MKKFTLIKYLICIALLLFLFSKVPVNDIISIVSKSNPVLLVYLFSISFLLIYISALKWKVFLEVGGQSVSILRLFTLYHVGYFANLLLPSFLGGDALRSFHIAKQVGMQKAFAATFLERYTGFAAMLILGLVFMFFSDVLSSEIKLFIVLANLALAIGTAMLLWKGSVSLFCKFPFISRFEKRLSGFQDALRFAITHKKVFFISMSLSLLFHCVTVVNTLAAAWVMNWWNAPVFELFVVLPVILLIAALPVTPSGLGLQEGAFFILLQAVGASPEAALGVALLLRAKAYILGLIGGLIYWKGDCTLRN